MLRIETLCSKSKTPWERALQSHAPNKRIYPGLMEYFLRQGYSKSMALLLFHRRSQSLVPNHSLFLAPSPFTLGLSPPWGFTLHFVYCELRSFGQTDKFESPISAFVSSEFFLFFKKKSGKFSKNVFF
jgi:hypothetical protein